MKVEKSLGFIPDINQDFPHNIFFNLKIYNKRGRSNRMQ